MDFRVFYLFIGYLPFQYLISKFEFSFTKTLSAEK